MGKICLHRFEAKVYNKQRCQTHRHRQTLTRHRKKTFDILFKILQQEISVLMVRDHKIKYSH